MKNRATTLIAASFSAIMLAGALALPAAAQENQMSRQPAHLTWRFSISPFCAKHRPHAKP
jgi:uncharacterized protein YggE